MPVAPLLLAAALATATPAADISKPQTLTHIDWARLPSTADFALHFPLRAEADGVSGWALISCRVDANGKLVGCKVAAEAPANYGFGAATLAIASTFKMKAPPSGAELPRARVHMPVFWQMPQRGPPPINIGPGEPSMIVTVAPRPEKRAGFFACPSQTDKSRYCQSHRVQWEKRPDIEEIDDLIKKAHGGTSDMECTIGDGGALEDCIVVNNGPQLTKADFTRLSTLFKAPANTGDHVSTKGNQVLLSFDWTKLATILAVFEGT